MKTKKWKMNFLKTSYKLGKLYVDVKRHKKSKREGLYKKYDLKKNYE